MNRGNLNLWALHRFPDKAAYIFRGRRVTFKQIYERSCQLCNGFYSIGLKKGNKIALLLNNCIETIECKEAIGIGGFALVALNTRHSAQEHKYVLNNSEADALVLHSEFIDVVYPILSQLKKVKYVIAIGAEEVKTEKIIIYEKLLEAQPKSAPEVDIDYNDINMIAYTSGTTGKPKGAVCTFQIAYNRAANILINLDSPILHTDVNLIVGPLAHAAGVMSWIYNIKGATNIITSKFDEEEILRTIEKERVTSILLVPTMMIRLLMVPNINSYDLSSLKRIWYGTAPMPTEPLKEAIEIFGNIFRQNYGLTEAPQPITYLSPEDHIISGSAEEVRRLVSAGRPAMGVSLRIVKENDHAPILPGEIGEIQIRCPQLMKEYWKNPEATAEAFREGWFHTGDLATIDDLGYVFIMDRKTDMIISGGFNIYPREVEDLLISHPGVIDAAVIGIPDKIWGESVKAFVVRKKEFSVTDKDLIQFCKENLASYKKPNSIDFVEELPRNTYGKVNRKEIKEPYWKGMDRKI